MQAAGEHAEGLVNQIASAKQQSRAKRMHAIAIRKLSASSSSPTDSITTAEKLLREADALDAHIAELESQAHCVQECADDAAAAVAAAQRDVAKQHGRLPLVSNCVEMAAGRLSASAALVKHVQQLNATALEVCTTWLHNRMACAVAASTPIMFVVHMYQLPLLQRSQS
jgi:hypothetical protein